MKTSASKLCLFALTVIGALLSAANGQPRNFGALPQATLRADRSIIVRPGESIILKYDTENGKITKLDKLPWDTKETESIMRIGITREGGVPTKLGPLSPILDSLTVWCSSQRPLAARCEYTTLSAPNPERTRVFDKEGRIQKAFRRGVSQVTLSELQFK